MKQDNFFTENLDTLDTIVYTSNTEFYYNIWGFKKTNLGLKVTGIYSVNILQILEKLGFHKRDIDNNTGYIFIKVDKNIIREVCVADIQAGFKADFIDELEDILTIDSTVFMTDTLIEKFLRQSHLFFNTNFLINLNTYTKPILKDTELNGLFPFENGIVQVSEQGLTLLSYDEYDSHCIWESNVIKFNFNIDNDNNTSHFNSFINNISANDLDTVKAFESAIGYLLHNYYDPTKTQSVILYDSVLNHGDTSQGGTGKGLFTEAIKQMSKMAVIDGRNYKSDNDFKFQSINIDSQVILIDDAGKQFNFEELFIWSSTGIVVNQKHKKSFIIHPSNGYKILITSNHVFDNQGTSKKRRQFPIALSDFYSSKIKNGTESPIKEIHGCEFFSAKDWNDKEWNCFYNYMLSCVAYYLKEGLQLVTCRNIEVNLLISQTTSEFVKWVESYGFDKDVKYLKETLYNSFIEFSEYDANKFTKHTHTKWLKRYSKYIDCELLKQSSNGSTFITFCTKK